MPRNTGVDILSIKPDSDLGLAQDTAIPVPAVALDQINKANQDLRSYQLQRNIMKYDQQLKQRDNLIKGLHEGEISTGAILPEDRAAYNESEKKVNDAFLAVASDEPDAKGQNEKLAAYHQAKQDHADLVTMLQARYAGVGKKRQDLAKAVLPSEQKRRQADIDKSIAADKWAPIIPYQEELDYEPEYLDKIGLNNSWVDDNGNPVSDVATTEKVTTNAKGTTVQKTTAPVKSVVKNGKLIPVSGEESKNGDLPIYTTTPGKKFEYRNVLANMIQAYNTDEKARVMMDKQLEMYQFSEDPQAHALFNENNQGLAIMDQQNGIPTIKHYPDSYNRVGPPNPNNPNDPVGKVEDTGIYPSEINHRYVGNKLVIEESAPSLAAKLIAGKMRNFKIEGQKSIDKDAFKLNEEKRQALEKEKIARGKLAIDRGELAVKWANLNKGSQEDKYAAGSVLNEAKDIIDKGEVVQVYNSKTKKNEDFIRIGDPNLLKSFAAINKEGKTTNLPDFIQYNPRTDQVELGYYDKKMNPTTHQYENSNTYETKSMDQRTWLKEITKRSFPNKDIGGVNGVIDEVLNKNGNSLYKLTNAGKSSYSAKMPDGRIITSKDGVNWFYSNGEKAQ